MKKLQVTKNNHLIITSSHLLIILLLFCFSAFLPSDSMAQKSSSGCDKEKPILFGIYMGPTVDWFSPNTTKITRDKVKGGVMAGIALDISVVKERYLFFSTGLLIRYLQGNLTFMNHHDIPLTKDTTYSLVLPTVRNYQTTYLTVPTGVKFRTPPMRGCVFLGKLGFYHNFKVGGRQVDNFTLPGGDPRFFVSTESIPIKDAALFAESGYLGIGFEYIFKNSNRVFTNVDYSCQFNYFKADAKNNITDPTKFRAVVHSLHIVFGVMF